MPTRLKSKPKSRRKCWIASRPAWAGQPLAEAKKESVEEPDQWTVAGQLRNLRPMYKYSWPDGQQVYLNGTTGEVVQYTTFGSRVAAHVSAIPHWVYYTPLRKHQPYGFEIHDLEFPDRHDRRDPRHDRGGVDVFPEEKVSIGRSADRNSLSRPETMALDLRNGVRCRHGDVDVQRTDVARPVSPRCSA